MKESQLQIPLIWGRTKHLMRCGMFIPFLHRHLEIFSSGGVCVCVCVLAHAHKLGPFRFLATPWTLVLHKQPHCYFTAFPFLVYVWGKHYQRQSGHSGNIQPGPNCVLYSSSLTHFSCVCLFVTLWTVTRQAPLSMGSSG